MTQIGSEKTPPPKRALKLFVGLIVVLILGSVVLFSLHDQTLGENVHKASMRAKHEAFGRPKVVSEKHKKMKELFVNHLAVADGEHKAKPPVVLSEKHQKHIDDMAKKALNRVGKLKCDDPNNEITYWRAGVPSLERMDSPYTPFLLQRRKGAKRYVTFEYDQGGWNNIRMAMESTLAFAMATHRTLVMPPEKRLYLLNKDSSKTHHSFRDFYDFEAILKHFPGVLMEYKDFLEVEGANLAKIAPLPRATTVEASLKYMRTVGKQVTWDALSVCVAFPPGATPFADIHEDQGFNKMLKKVCGSRSIETYTEVMEDSPLLHFPQGVKNSRLLAHFYAFDMIGDPPFDRYVKRFMRDHFHYRGDIFCHAKTVIDALKAESPTGLFNAFHVRRNDFQFKEAWEPMNEIMENAKDVILNDDSIVYVATDEKASSYFAPLLKKKNTRFLKDYLSKGLLKDVNSNLFGMIEQIIVSNSHHFMGTWWSTFTGYCNRMRGYKKLDKQSWYYPKQFKMEMQSFKVPDAAGWWREWPTCWEDIDEK